MPENHKLTSILDHLKENISHLEQKQNLTLEEYLTKWDERDIVERELEKAIQSCLDVGTRVIASNHWRRPEDNHEIFDILAENGTIEFDLAQSVKELIGLRNVLAHEYRRIRNDEVYRHMQKSTGTLRKFAAVIASKL